MQVDKKTAQLISRDLEAAAKEIFAKHGLEQKKLQTGYGDHYSFKVTAEQVDLDESGVNLASEEARSYKLFAKSYDLPEGLLGTKFTVSGKEYVFAGLATSRPKYPIYARDISEEKNVFFPETVKRLLVGAK